MTAPEGVTGAEQDDAVHRLLDLEVPEIAEGATTVRGYLTALLATLWEQEEEFSSKRPFGGSGWRYDLLIPMARAGMIDGTFDPDGDLVSCDDDAGNVLIAAAIKAMGAESLTRREPGASVAPSGRTAPELAADITELAAERDEARAALSRVTDELREERAARLHRVGERDAARSDLERMRDLAGEILGSFGAGTGGGYRARAGQVQYGRWQERAAGIGARK